VELGYFHVIKAVKFAIVCAAQCNAMQERAALPIYASGGGSQSSAASELDQAGIFFSWAAPWPNALPTCAWRCH
jgi:hypothetical protein